MAMPAGMFAALFPLLKSQDVLLQLNVLQLVGRVRCFFPRVVLRLMCRVQIMESEHGIKVVLTADMLSQILSLIPLDIAERVRVRFDPCCCGTLLNACMPPHCFAGRSVPESAEHRRAQAAGSALASVKGPSDRFVQPWLFCDIWSGCRATATTIGCGRRSCDRSC